MWRFVLDRLPVGGGCRRVIISRYLIRKISKPLTIILGILIALFASYSAAVVLSDAVNGLLPIDTVAEMIGLKALISLEVLIPVSLYFSVVLSFGKLNGDSEFTAMFALRVSPARVMGAVLTLSGCLALFVAGLSLVTRPWAYERLHELSKRAEVTLDVTAMDAGTFYVGQHGNRVIFLSHRDGPASPAQDVFVQLWHNDRTEIVHARLAYPLSQTHPNSRSLIYLSQPHIHENGHDEQEIDRALQPQGIIVRPNRSADTP